MQKTISFVLDGKIQTIEFNSTFSPTTTVLNYLRSQAEHKGVKEGCAEGDCGACTVVIAELGEGNTLKYNAWDSCLVFLPMIHGKQLITVENLCHKKGIELVLHPVQEALVSTNGSQCGYCTPGIVMSLFALYKNEHGPAKESIEDALTGNLCRCTGYKPIVEAAAKACVHKGQDQFSDSEAAVVALLRQIQQTNSSLEIETGSQTYRQPLTLAEACNIRQSRPDSVLLSGGTDVALRVTKKHELLADVIDLSHIQELKIHTSTATHLVFGAGLSLEEVKALSQNTVPALYEALSVFGSRQIRCLATLGGNLGSGSPIGDTLPVLMASGAEVILQSTKGERVVPMSEFILGYRKTNRKPNELIRAIRIPRTDAHTLLKFYKVSKRKDLDISTVSACFRLHLNTGKVASLVLAYGGMAAVTKCASHAEAYLLGKNWDRTTVEHAMAEMEQDFTPLTDARSGAAFRMAAAKNLLLKFWSETNTLLKSA